MVLCLCPKIITFNIVHDVDRLMNPLKERRTVTTTKAITTLFISTALVVGFMTMSLGLSQTASAQPTPQCPEGTTFDRGECIAIVEVCPPGTDLEQDDKCFEEVDKTEQCLTPPRIHLVNGVCLPSPEANPASGTAPTLACPPETDLEQDDKCYVEVDKIEEEERTRPGQGPVRPV